MKRKQYDWIVFLVIAILVTFFSVITGNFFTKKLSLQIGEIAPETIYAPFQVENEIATKRKEDLAEKEVETTYKIDSTISESAINDIEKLFEYVKGVQDYDASELAEKKPVDLLSSRSPIPLYNEQYENLLLTDSEDLEYMKEVCVNIATNLFTQGIREEDAAQSTEIKNQLEETKLSSTKQKIALDILNNIITVNVVEDEAATNEDKKIARDKVDPVYVLTGEKIIEKGTKVTDETYSLLEKVGYLDTDKEMRYNQYVGIGIVILTLLALAAGLRKTAYANKKVSSRQLSLFLILYTIGIMLTRGLLGLSLVYLPLSIPGMLMTFASSPVVGCLLHLLVVIFSAIIFKGDIVFILYFIIVGISSILLITLLQERTKTMINALMIGFIHFIIYIGLKLFIGTTLSVGLLIDGLAALIMGMIAMIAVTGTLPLLETSFGFVTPMQLLELTNPNQPILKRLLLEATGTYYHSLLVANLAEAAADRIGANPLMARVGGYYHDIGKLTCSNYFKENQGVSNPHDYMRPRESYEVIVSHVTSGLKLAEEYKLPQYIKDMISQHHGTTTMQFFYMKAREEEGDAVTEEAFRYPGPKPKTKEAALVMLADVVEATTRSMQDKLGPDLTIEALVTKMVRQKLKEGQLDECELYISDIDKIIESFTKMLTGMYHQRIKYPERNDK